MAVDRIFSWLALSVAVLIILPYSSAIPAHGSRAPKTLKIPMRELTHGASFNITVGTPPQTIVLLSDWTWQNTWVDTPHCNGIDNPSACIPTGQNYFDDSLSSTFRNLTDSQQSFNGTDYTPGIPFNMFFGTDTVCMQGLNGAQLCSPNSEVALSKFAKELPFVEDIGGIFGFAPVLPGYNKTYEPTPYQFMQNNLLEPVIGWHMCGDLHTQETCYGEDFLTVMGGTTTEVYDKKRLVYHPIVVDDCINSGVHLSLKPSRNNYWSASWSGLWLDGTSFSLQNPNISLTNPCNAINPIAIMDQDAFGHGAPVPQAAFDYLVEKTRAVEINATSPISVNGGRQGLWEVPCSDIQCFPTITYELSGTQNITSAPDQYIDTEFIPGKCFLNARVWDRDIDGAQTFFGLTVLSHTYVVFDYERVELGLAPLWPKLYN